MATWQVGFPDFPGETDRDRGERAVWFGELELRPDSRQLISGSARLQLTMRELQVLMVLIKHIDRVIPRDFIYRQVWGGTMPYRDRSIDTYVRRIRQKLSLLEPSTAFIHTHFGIGYRFWPERPKPVAY